MSNSRVLIRLSERFVSSIGVSPLARNLHSKPRFANIAIPLHRTTTISTRYSSTESQGNNKEAGSETSSAEGASSESDAASAKPADIPTHTEQLIKLQKEIKDLKDQIVRSYAEEENVRRIAKKDVESARQYANQSFAKAMLEVSDNLERALSTIPTQVKEDLKSGKGELPTALAKELVVGIEMTEKGLQKTFGSFGVVKYGTVGDNFDPALHDALFQGPNPAMPNNTISTVLKTGYKLKDRIIRAAQVGTVVNP